MEVVRSEMQSEMQKSEGEGKWRFQKGPTQSEEDAMEAAWSEMQKREGERSRERQADHRKRQMRRGGGDFERAHKSEVRGWRGRAIKRMTQKEKGGQVVSPGQECRKGRATCEL